MIKIALIDDKSYWLDQIRSIHHWEQFTLDYFETFQSFNSWKQYYDIIYLDYYLDKDWITWDKVVSQVKTRTKKLVWFSSVQSCWLKLVNSWADTVILKQ